MSADGGSTQTSTTSSFISALVVGVITVGVLTAFLVWIHGQRKYRRVYQPRLELCPDGKKPRELPTGIVAWWRAILSTPDTDIIPANGLDSYLFVRFLKTFGIGMLIPYSILTIAICVPAAAYSPNKGNSGLNKLTFGNVPASNQNRHIAHFIVEVILMAWTLYLIHREYTHLVIMRQQWLASEYHQKSTTTRTVMLVNVPSDRMSEEALREMSAGESGSGHRMVWLARKTKKIEKVYEERNKECLRLEGAEAKIQKLAAKNVTKGKVSGPSGPSDHKVTGGQNSNNINLDPENRTNRTEGLMDKYLLPKQKAKKTSWKQGFLGLFGAKMDFKSSPSYIRSKNEELEQIRSKTESIELGNVAWIRFPTQFEAHHFARTIKKQKGNMMVQTGVEVHPDDVIWANTSQNPYQRKIGAFLAIALTALLIIFWVPITVFVGAVTSLTSLCSYSWMSWFCNSIPNAVQGIIQGILPPAILAIELALVAPVLRAMMNKLSAVPRHSDIEVKLYNRYSCFMYIHGFLIVTLASGLLASLTTIGGQVDKIPTLLATNLPGSSIFFLTYILSATWSASAKSYSRVVPFIMYLLNPILLGSTPRKRYAGEHKLASFSFGSLAPSITLLTVIILAYSTVQPIITIIGLIAFALLYASYKYLFLFAADQPEHMETGGLIITKMLNSVFAAVYLSLICLMGLMFISTDANGGRARSGLVCGALLAVCIVLTAVYNFWINRIAFPIEKTMYASASFAHGGHSAGEGDADRVGGASDPHSHNHAFDNPALWVQQKPIWIANDGLGFGTAEVDRLTDENLDASCRGATMDSKGKLTVERPPPEEEEHNPEEM